jgi:hypothetical protein
MKNEQKTFNQTIDIAQLLPIFHPRLGVRLDITTQDNLISINWVNRNKEGQPLNPQNQPKILTVPRFIAIDENFGEIMGLYFGDGTKNDRRCIEFANFCPELIKLWIKHISDYGIDVNGLSFKVQVSENAKIKYNINEEKIIDYWKRIINIPFEKEIKLIWVKANGSPSSYLQMYGTLSAIFNNTTLSLFYNTLIKNIPRFIEQNHPFRIGFMRGLIAADGNINIRKNGSLSLVRIADDKNERNFISHILEKYFKIKTKEDQSNQIFFGCIKKFKKIKKLNLHTLHPDKKILFERGYHILFTNLNKKHDENIVLKNKKAINIIMGISTIIMG